MFAPMPSRLLDSYGVGLAWGRVNNHGFRRELFHDSELMLQAYGQLHLPRRRLHHPIHHGVAVNRTPLSFRPIHCCHAATFSAVLRRPRSPAELRVFVLQGPLAWPFAQ